MGRDGSANTKASRGDDEQDTPVRDTDGEDTQKTLLRMIWNAVGGQDDSEAGDSGEQGLAEERADAMLNLDQFSMFVAALDDHDLGLAEVGREETVESFDFTLDAGADDENERSFMRRVSSAFNALDVDGDGTVDVHELAKAMGSEEQAREIMSVVDADGDGVMSRDEFAAMMANEAWTEEDRIADVFNALDTDGNGTVDVNELAKAIGSEEQAREILAAIDTDGDGVISRDEFETMMVERKRQLTEDKQREDPHRPSQVGWALGREELKEQMVAKVGGADALHPNATELFAELACAPEIEAAQYNKVQDGIEPDVVATSMVDGVVEFADVQKAMATSIASGALEPVALERAWMTASAKSADMVASKTEDASADASAGVAAPPLNALQFNNFLHALSAEAAEAPSASLPPPADDNQAVAPAQPRALTKTERLLQVFAEMDVNNDGTVTFTEMAAHWRHQTAEFRKTHTAESAEAEEAFAALEGSLFHEAKLFACIDEDGSGEVTADEFVHAFSKAGHGGADRDTETEALFSAMLMAALGDAELLPDAKERRPSEQKDAGNAPLDEDKVSSKPLTVAEQLLRVFNEMDVNNDGSITFTEMTKRRESIRRGPRKPSLRRPSGIAAKGQLGGALYGDQAPDQRPSAEDLMREELEEANRNSSVDDSDPLARPARWVSTRNAQIGETSILAADVVPPMTDAAPKDPIPRAKSEIARLAQMSGAGAARAKLASEQSHMVAGEAGAPRRQSELARLASFGAAGLGRASQTGVTIATSKRRESIRRGPRKPSLRRPSGIAAKGQLGGALYGDQAPDQRPSAEDLMREELEEANRNSSVDDSDPLARPARWVSARTRNTTGAATTADVAADAELADEPSVAEIMPGSAITAGASADADGGSIETADSGVTTKPTSAENEAHVSDADTKAAAAAAAAAAAVQAHTAAEAQAKTVAEAKAGVSAEAEAGDVEAEAVAAVQAHTAAEAQAKTEAEVEVNAQIAFEADT
eukprot:g4780.t1